MPVLKIRSHEAAKMSKSEWKAIQPFGLWDIPYEVRTEPHTYRFSKYSWLEIVDDPEEKDKEVDDMANQLMLIAVSYTSSFGDRLDAKVPSYSEMYPRIKFFEFIGDLDEYVYLMRKVYMYLYAIDEIVEGETLSKSLDYLERMMKQEVAQEVIPFAEAYGRTKHTGFELEPKSVELFLKVFRETGLICDSVFLANLKHPGVYLAGYKADRPYTALENIYRCLGDGKTLEDSSAPWCRAQAKEIYDSLTDRERRIFDEEGLQYMVRLRAAMPPPPPKPEPEPKPKSEPKAEAKPEPKPEPEMAPINQEVFAKRRKYKEFINRSTPVEEVKLPSIFGAEFESHADEVKPTRWAAKKQPEPRVYASNIGGDSARVIKIDGSDCWHYGTDESYCLRHYHDSIIDYLGTIGEFDKYMG